MEQFNAVNIFIKIIIIFLIILTLSSLFYIIHSPEFELFLKKSPSLSQVSNFLYQNIISLHPLFVIFSLLLTFLMVYTFIDLKVFHIRRYILAILAIPIIICAGIYYFEHYIFKGLFSFKSAIPVPMDSLLLISFTDPLKIYFFSFLIFIIIPGAVLVNTETWRLKSLIFLFGYLFVIFYIFKYFNPWFMDILNKTKALNTVYKYPIMKKLPEIRELILTVIYIPAGIYILKIADSIHKIRKRINLGEIKKIQYK